MNFNFISDPRWSTLDRENQDRMLNNAFEKGIASDNRWGDLSSETQQSMKAAYFRKAEEYERYSGAPEKRGLLSSVTSHAGRGIVSAIGMVGEAAQLADLTPEIVDEDIGFLDKFGKGITDWSEKTIKESPYLRPSKAELSGDIGFVKRGVMGGIESMPLSATVAAGALSGALATSWIPVPGARIAGGTVGGLVALVTTFGAGTYGKEYKEAYKDLELRTDIDEQEKRTIAHRVAFGSAAFEVGTELPEQLLALYTLGGSKVLTSPIKATLKNMVRKPASALIKGTALQATGQVPGEMVAGGGQAWMRQREGLPGPGIGEAVKESIIPAITMSLFFGTGAAGFNYVQSQEVMSRLNSDDVNIRSNAANQMAKRITVNTQDESLGNAWLQNAQDTIAKEEKFDFDEKIVNFASVKTAEDLDSAGRLTDLIDKGMQTGEFKGKSFAPNDAFRLIKQGRLDNIFNDEDINQFKEKYPELRERLEGKSSVSDIGKAPTVDKAITAFEQATASAEQVYGAARKRVGLLTPTETMEKTVETYQPQTTPWQVVKEGEGVEVMARPQGLLQPKEPTNIFELQEGVRKRQAEAAAKERELVLQRPALSPGQGFEITEPKPETRLRPSPEKIEGPTYPEGTEYVAGKPAPEGLEVEHKPTLTGQGTPYKNKRQAENALKSHKRLERMGITPETHEVISVKGGYGIRKKTEVSKEIDAKAQEAATSSLNAEPEPTEAQIEAGNYKKGHIKFQDLDISIENPKGSERKGIDSSDKKWSVTMKHHYGYIKETVGKDKEHLDVFVGNNPESKAVFIVDQINPKTRTFDEHKIIVGTESIEEAQKTYLDNYEKGWRGLGNISEIKMDHFKEWIESGNTKKPFNLPAKEEKLKAASKKVKAETPTMLKESDKVNDVTLGTLVDIAAEDPAKALEHAAEATVSKAKLIEGIKNKGLKAMGEAKSKEERAEIKKNLEETLRGIEEGEVETRLYKKREFLKKKLTALQTTIKRSDETDMPGGFVTGRSGVPKSRLKKIERQTDRRIDRAVEFEKIRNELKYIDAQIEAQKKAPEKKVLEEKVKDYSEKQFDEIKVGDLIDVGGNDLAKVIKKNRKTVIVEGGSKWTASEIARVEKPKEPVAEALAKEPWEMRKEEFLRPVRAAAYLDKETEKIIEGTPEEVHFQIAERANLSLEDIEVRYEPGFTNHKGKFLTREEANRLIRRPDRKTQLVVHKEFVQEALKSSKLTPEKYAELHEKDYGPLEKFIPEVAEVVKRALKDNVVDIDQLSLSETKALNYAVEKGILEKARGGSYPMLHTVYAKPGYDFKGEREKALEKLKGKQPGKEPLSETKSRLLENIKSEKGSSELINDLSRLGADAIKRGHTSFKAFSAEMKTVLGDAWAKVKHLMQEAYRAARKTIVTVKRWNEKPDTWEIYEKKSGEIVDILKPGENKIDYADIDILLGIDKTYGIRKAKKIPVEMLPKIIKSERGLIGGRKAKGAPTRQLAKAQEMLAEGKDKNDIWRETGWMKGAEKGNVWKFEIDDSGFKWKNGKPIGENKDWMGSKYNKALELKGKIPTIADIFEHKELFSFYPQAKNIKLKHIQGQKGGVYYAHQNVITLDCSNAIRMDQPTAKLILHEIQHAIQEIEGFAPGGSPEAMAQKLVNEETNYLLKTNDTYADLAGWIDELYFKGEGYDAHDTRTYRGQMQEIFDKHLDKKYGKDPALNLYKRLAGEIEAREVEIRKNLTKEQRRIMPPYVGAGGIPQDQWIVTDGKGTSFSVEAPKPEAEYGKEQQDLDVWAKSVIANVMKGVFLDAEVKQGIKNTKKIADNPSSPEGFNIPTEGKSYQVFDLLQFKLQDRLNSLKKIQGTIEKQKTTEIPDDVNAYQTEELYHGKVSRRIEEFDANHIDPLAEAINGSGFDLKDVESYLYARHAPEANTRLEEINPKREDNKALSGMTNEKSAEIMAKYQGNKAMANIAKQVDAITKKTRKILVDEGLATSEEINAWEQAYKFYVPLKREGKDVGLPKRGTGMDIRGTESKKRLTGSSERKAVNILSNILAQHEATIIRAEKVKVGRAMFRLAKEHKSDLWKVDAPELKPFLKQRKADTGEVDSFTGLPVSLSEVVFGRDILYKFKDNVFVVKIDGKEHTITFNEENVHAQRIAKGLKNLGANSGGALINIFSSVNRILAIVNTSANPEFILSNFARDIQTAGYNINDTEAKNIKARIFKDVFKAMQGIRQGIRGKYDTEWAKNYREFAKAGAQTGWIDHYKNIEVREKALKKKLGNLKGGGNTLARRTANHLFELISNENTAVENAIRLSTYIHLIRIGLSKDKAASAARNLTVNFNRKGDAGQALNAFYLFFNANIQGSTRLIYAAIKSPTVRKMMVGTVAFATMLDVLNRAIGGDDDDGEKKYDKIPTWVKEHNLILMRSNGDYFKIPLPWGYNTLHVLGQIIGEAVDPSKDEFSSINAAGRLAGAVIGSFNPLGSESSVFQVLSPTLVDPFIQWVENKNFAGIPLKPEQLPFDVPKPEYQMHWSNARTPSKWLTEKLNNLSGGDEIHPGIIDVSPEVFDLFLDTFTGGAGKFLSNTIDLPETLTKKDVDIRRIPFVRRVYGEPSEFYVRTKFYDNLNEIRYAEKSEDHYIKIKDYKSLAETRKKYRDILKFKARAKNEQRIIKQHRDQRKKIEAMGKLSKERKEFKIDIINQKIRQKMVKFNLNYKNRRIDNEK